MSALESAATHEPPHAALLMLRERTRPPRLKKTLLSRHSWGRAENLQVWSVYRQLHRALKDLDSWGRLAQELSPMPWLVLRDPQQQIRAEVSRQVCAANALQAELEAAVGALQTVSAFGERHVQLCTDALSVVKAFEGVLAPRHSVHEALLQRMALALDSVEVLRVPRLVTRTADALAAQATERAEPARDTLNTKVLEFSRILV